MSPRIRGTWVPAHFPDSDSVSAMIFGEAPGPRGADKSGIPFYGDRAGDILYRALVDAGRCEFPVDIADLEWDGEALTQTGIIPRLIDTAISNAYHTCPTDDGEKFRAPTRAELTSDENLEQLRGELDEARRRGLRQVLVLGRPADWMLGSYMKLRDDPDIEYGQIIHPSPLGLLGMKRQLGDPSLRMRDLQRIWMERFRGMLTTVTRKKKR